MKIKISFKIDITEDEVIYSIDDSKVSKYTFNKLYEYHNRDTYNKNKSAMDLSYKIGYYDGQIDLTDTYVDNMNSNKDLFNTFKKQAIKELKDYIK